MKNIIPLIAASALLTACAATMSDSSIHRRVVGMWSVEGSQPGKIIENGSDGTTVLREDGVETARGKWQIKDGYIVVHVIGSNTESNKVLRVSGNEMLLLSMDGQT